MTDQMWPGRGLTMAEVMAEADDLESVRDALVHEFAIRHAMAETGEDRQTIVDTMGAVESMDQEAVLELTSGAPTTLADGIQALIESIDAENGVASYIPSDVVTMLHALLTYPWPEEEAVIGTHASNASVSLRVEEPDDDHLEVYVGGQKVAEADYETHTRSGMQAVQDVAEAVHKAILARVIGDRPHHVQLNSSDRASLLRWLERPNGYWRPADMDSRPRVGVDAVEGGGVLIKTQPYVYVEPVSSRRPS